MGRYATTAYLLGGVRLDRIATRYPVRTKPDQWLVATEADPIIVSIADARSKFGLPVLAVQCLVRPEDQHPRLYFTCPADGGPMLEMQAQELEHTSPSYAERNCVYLLQGLLYHLRNLVRAYCDALLQVAAYHAVDESGPPGWATADPYFEFEALITVAVRYYETLRYSLWERFGRKGSSAPRNFMATVRRVRTSALTELLERAVDHYNALKDYRDCIQHNAHFGAAFPGVVTTVRGGIRVASAWIPDNPQAKSYTRFKYNQRLDALAFAYDHINVCFQTANLLWTHMGAELRHLR